MSLLINIYIALKEYSDAVHAKTVQVVAIIEDLPTGMVERHRNLTLKVDIMYINEIPCVIKVLQAIPSLLKMKNW